MAKPTGLINRAGTYYYRRRVPKELVETIGKKEIKESLKTSDLAEAKTRCNVRAVACDALFAKAAEIIKLGQTAAKPSKPLSEAGAIKLVQDYVKRTDDEWRKRHAKEGLGNAKQKQDMLEEMLVSQTRLIEPDDLDGELEIYSKTNELLTKNDLTIGKGGISSPELAAFVRRGLLELYRRDAARLSDDHSTSSFDNLFSDDGAASHNVPTLDFGELCSEYFSEYSEDAKFKKTQQKRIDKVKSHLRLIEEMVGSETNVGDIDYTRCVAFRNTLAKVPKNMRKHYGDIPIQEAISLAEEDGRPMMSYVTQQGYLGTLSATLKLAVMKGLLPTVPSADLVPHAENISSEDKRKPFTVEQLNAIFYAPLYVGEVDGGLEAVKFNPGSIHCARFWVPLIFLFTGMRPNEICQLYVEDLRASDEGIPFFRVAMDQPDKKVKNLTSERSFPVHPTLVKIGLLYHVSKQEAGGHARLFPSLKPDSYGYYSTRVSDWFSETFLKSVIEKDDRQSFYSLRHNFRDALRHAEAPEWVLEALGGWKQGKKTSDDYGTKNLPDPLHKWVVKVQYPGLDLSHLYLKGTKTN